MKKLLMLALIVPLLTLEACSGLNASNNGASGSSTGAAVQVAGTSDAAIALQQAMRKLWSEHVIWTREYIVAAVAGAPDARAAANRLMKNQDDIGNAIVPYYGSDAGIQLSGLLRQHILIAVDLVAAAKAGDDAKMREADARWNSNASDIATFLSTANPNWPKQDMVDMLNNHLALTTQEVTARLNGKWNEDVIAFDSILTQALGMADGLSDGIIKQFPEKFK